MKNETYKRTLKDFSNHTSSTYVSTSRKDSLPDEIFKQGFAGVSGGRSRQVIYHWKEDFKAHLDLLNAQPESLAVGRDLTAKLWSQFYSEILQKFQIQSWRKIDLDLSI